MSDNLSTDYARPAFLITIDTEGDDLWSRPRAVQTRNAGSLPRFQALCERHHLKPVYLTNWEMANSTVFQALARDAQRRGTAEIGMHLHAWDSPPLAPLTADDCAFHPYLVEYPEPILREKIHALTARLEDQFQMKMVSHRAGRWAFDATYARALVDEGYRVDCSVTPHVSWRATLGDPSREGGTDYSACPEAAYWVDQEDIRRPGDGPLLEVPVTIVANPALPRAIARSGHGRWRDTADARLGSRVLRKVLPPWLWLRPTGRNLRHLLAVLDVATRERRPYVEFMLHSSELMPGGSPTFPTGPSIETLYADLERLFATAHERFRGMTLSQYYDSFVAARPLHGAAASGGESC